MLIHYINSHTVYHRQYRTDYNRNSKFLEHHFKKVRKMNFIKCNTSDYKSRTLCAAVTAGIHYHRHKRNQKRYCRKCGFIPIRYNLCNRCTYHKYQKPYDTAFCVFKNTCSEIRFLIRCNSRHF